MGVLLHRVLTGRELFNMGINFNDPLTSIGVICSLLNYESRDCYNKYRRKIEKCTEYTHLLSCQNIALIELFDKCLRLDSKIRCNINEYIDVLTNINLVLKN